MRGGWVCRSNSLMCVEVGGGSGGGVCSSNIVLGATGKQAAGGGNRSEGVPDSSMTHVLACLPARHQNQSTHFFCLPPPPSPLTH